MVFATWNLNNRAGQRTLRLEAARTAIALEADVIVLTEYYPKGHHAAFGAVLEDAGWTQRLFSVDPSEKANRVLIAARTPIELDDLALPTFDQEFPANMVAAHFPVLDLKILGVRVPAYEGPTRGALLRQSWAWLEATASAWRDSPAVIVGDLNVRLASPRGSGGNHFRSILSSGWNRAQPSEGASYIGPLGARSEIDHLLATERCRIASSRYVTEIGGFKPAGTPEALSDHAALVVEVVVPRKDSGNAGDPLHRSTPRS